MTGVPAIHDLDHPQLAMPPGGCWFHGSLELHLGVEAERRPSTQAHLAFRCAEVDVMARHLEVGGHHAVIWNGRLPGLPRLYNHDPFGNRLEFLGSVGLGGSQRLRMEAANRYNGVRNRPARASAQACSRKPLLDEE